MTNMAANRVVHHSVILDLMGIPANFKKGVRTIASVPLWPRAVLYMFVVGSIHYVAVPLLITAGEPRLRFRRGWPAALGAGLAASGVALAFAAAHALVTRGQGTPFPLDPTRRLVVDGPYRHLRNPQAVAATLIVAGEVLAIRSRRLWLLLPLTVLYLEGFAAQLERREMVTRFGSAYLAYRQRVPAWLPRLESSPGDNYRAGGRADTSPVVD
jgi:protein-S-isoprenylcysteine O-methyltransferase Ste14